MTTWHGFTVVDGVVGLLLLAGLVGGVRRGLSGELVRAIIAVSAVVAAMLYVQPVSKWIQARWTLESRINVIGSFLLVMVGVYAVITFVRILLGRLADFTFKGPTERIGGGVCGLIRAAAVSAFLLLLLGMAPNENLHRIIVEESVTGRLVNQHVRPLYEELSERVPEIRVPELAIPETPATADPLYEIPATLMEDADEVVEEVKDLELGELP